MSLISFLPGGAATWLCEDDTCSVSPLTKAVFCVFTLATARPFASCNYYIILGGFFYILCETLSITIPLILLKTVVFGAVAAHVPMLKRGPANMFIIACLLVGAGSATGQLENVMVLFLFGGIVLCLKRLVLTIATLRASTPTPMIFPIVSHILPNYSFSEEQFFRTDSPPEEIAQKRKDAFRKLKVQWDAKFPKSIGFSTFLRDSFSDLRFASSNRVFIPFKKHLDNWCDPCTVVASVDRTDLIDVDGHRLTDVSGSYGVNVCGYDMYKQFITEGWDLVKNVGCVLGPVHPLLEENIKILKQVSNKQEVSFHMSGTEAVMCAVRVCRFNTRKPLVVLFGGAYHGWWDGVQSLAGNERTPTDVLTLIDMLPASMDVIKMRASEIAAVVINPLQGFHPNAPPPSDLSLASNTRKVSESSLKYKKWLEDLRTLCTELKIVLIFDEVYTGFRLAPGGAQEYFGVNADVVVYGKTTGGGIPNGVVCGPKELMNRGDSGKPLRVAYVIGTFSAHPLLLGAMNRFLNWVITPEARAQYDRLRSDVQDWVAETNDILEKEFPTGNAPLALGAYSSVWTMLFKRPGRYHWMLQYYLKDEGVNLSWVGTGRLSFSLDFTRKDMDMLREKIIKACHRMEDDGWWWDASTANGKSPSGAGIKLSLGKEIVVALIKRIFS